MTDTDKKVTGFQVCRELVEVLGIGVPIRSIQIEARCGDLPIVKVEMSLRDSQMKRLGILLKKYRLVEEYDREPLEPEVLVES